MKKLLLLIIVCVTSIRLIGQTEEPLNYELECPPVGTECYLSVGMAVTTSYTGNIVIPDTAYYEYGNSSTNTYPVKAIGDKAFEYSQISSVTLPKTLTEVGESAFRSCYYLTKVFYLNDYATYQNIFFKDSALLFYSSTPVALYVYSNYFDDFNTDELTKYFDAGVFPIAEGEVSITMNENTVINNTIDFSWFLVEGVTKYTLTVYENTEVKWIYTFDENGELLDKTNKMPAMIKETNSSMKIGLTEIGPLTNNVTYNYQMEGTNAEQTLYNVSGSFQITDNEGNKSIEQTQTEIESKINEVFIQNPATRKIMRQGQVLIELNDKTYNVLGKQM